MKDQYIIKPIEGRPLMKVLLNAIVEINEQFSSRNNEVSVTIIDDKNCDFTDSFYDGIKGGMCDISKDYLQPYKFNPFRNKNRFIIANSLQN